MLLSVSFFSSVPGEILEVGGPRVYSEAQQCVQNPSLFSSFYSGICSMWASHPYICDLMVTIWLPQFQPSHSHTNAQPFFVFFSFVLTLVSLVHRVPCAEAAHPHLHLRVAKMKCAAAPQAASRSAAQTAVQDGGAAGRVQ